MKRAAVKPAKWAIDKLQKQDIKFMNNHFVIVNKPAGMISQSDHSKDNTIVSLVSRHLKEHAQKEGNVYVGLPHRLDEAASGVICLTRTSKAAARMTALFKERKVEKEYVVVVHGYVVIILISSRFLSFY